MKKALVFAILVSVLSICAGVLCSCNKNSGDSSTDTDNKNVQIIEVEIVKDSSSNFIIVYGNDSALSKSHAEQLYKTIKEKYKVKIKVVSDSEEIPAENGKIYIDETRFDLSKKISDKSNENDGHNYGIAVENGNVALYAADDTAYQRLEIYLFNNFSNKEGIVLNEGFIHTGFITDAQAELVKKMSSFSLTDFGEATNQTFSTSFVSTDAVPTEKPIEGHPRLLITKDDLPALREKYSKSGSGVDLTKLLKNYASKKVTGY